MGGVHPRNLLEYFQPLDLQGLIKAWSGSYQSLVSKRCQRRKSRTSCSWCNRTFKGKGALTIHRKSCRSPCRSQRCHVPKWSSRLPEMAEEGISLCLFGDIFDMGCQQVSLGYHFGSVKGSLQKESLLLHRQGMYLPFPERIWAFWDHLASYSQSSLEGHRGRRPKPVRLLNELLLSMHNLCFPCFAGCWSLEIWQISQFFCLFAEALGYCREQ